MIPDHSQDHSLLPDGLADSRELRAQAERLRLELKRSIDEVRCSLQAMKRGRAEAAPSHD